MSQINLYEIIQQQQKQLAAIQVQIQALLAEGAEAAEERREGGAVNIEVAKPQLFDRTSSKVTGFVTGCKLYIRNKLAGVIVEAQVQWVLSYM